MPPGRPGAQASQWPLRESLVKSGPEAPRDCLGWQGSRSGTLESQGVLCRLRSVRSRAGSFQLVQASVSRRLGRASRPTPQDSWGRERPHACQPPGASPLRPPGTSGEVHVGLRVSLIGRETGSQALSAKGEDVRLGTSRGPQPHCPPWWDRADSCPWARGPGGAAGWAASGAAARPGRAHATPSASGPAAAPLGPLTRSTAAFFGGSCHV